MGFDTLTVDVIILEEKMLFEEIRKDLFRFVVPLNIESLRSVNVYAVRGSNLSLIVDTGMGTDEVFSELIELLKSLDIMVGKSLLLITHFHIDHFGFAKKMLSMGAKLLISEKDWERTKWVKSKILREEAASFLSLCGCPMDRENFSFFAEADSVYDVEESDRVYFVSHNEKIEIGDYRFLALSTPGHSPGHITLYEPDTCLYISGDHILKDISPTIQARKFHDNPLKDYLKSLRDTSRLKINLVLPSHGDPFFGVRKRIAELFHHHKKRLNEIVSILEEGGKTVYEIASLMEWETEVKDFHELPVRHKIFAMGEAFAHTNYLKSKGRISYSVDGEKGTCVCYLKKY